MKWILELASLGNQTKHGKRWERNGKNAYGPVKGPITSALINEHLKGGDESLAIYLNRPRKEGGAKEMSRILVLDFDDHDQIVNPQVMESRVGAVVGVLMQNQIPHFVVRSGGGYGYHIWFVFEEPRRDDSLREGANDILKSANKLLHQFWPNEEFIGTTKGGKMFVQSDMPHSGTGKQKDDHKKHFIETIPKGKGNHLIALPLGRKSILMEAELQDDGFAKLEPHPDPASFQIEYSKRKTTGPKPKTELDAPDQDAAFDAMVTGFDVYDYHDWVAVTMRLIAAFSIDDEWAKRRWMEWSQTGNWQDGDEKKWDECHNTRLSPITFWLDAAKAGYKGNTPFSKGEKRKLTAIKYIENIPLFRDEVGIAFAKVGDRSYMPIRSERFKGIVARGIYRTLKEPADEGMLKSVITLAVTFAEEEPRHPINLRFAENGNKRYLFLADDDFTIIEIDADGWRVCDDPPVRFRLGDSQPIPIALEGDIEEFICFLNIDRENICFVLAWMMNAICSPAEQCPILLLDGTAGTCKTSALKTIVMTLDPKVGAQAGPPKNEDDLFAAAYSGAVVSFDNVSTLGNLSDELCRLSTGGGLRKRLLYTDAETFSLEAKRPIIVAGIDPTMYQQDLIERVVRVELTKPDVYMNDMEFERSLKEKLPRFTGAILTLASKVMGMMPIVESENVRFGEFVRYGECVARLLGMESGWFTKEHDNRLRELAVESADADSVVIFLASLIGRLDKDRTVLTKSAAELWTEMRRQIDDGLLIVSREDVPKNARVMGSRINRAIGILKAEYGITVNRGPRRAFVFSWEHIDPAALLNLANPEEIAPVF